MRESIFVSAVRSFFTWFAAILGILLALAAIGVGIAFVSGPTLLPKGTEMTILPDAQGNRQMLSDSAPVILRISIHGVVGIDDLTGDIIDQILLDSSDGFLKNNRIKAILLHMDTPGGMVVDGDHIYRSLVAYKNKHSIPIYAYVDGLCASGGVYIASAADKIYATPVSVVGSVGVIMGPLFNFSGAMDKIGIQSLTLSDGKGKDELNPFRPWEPGEDQSLKAITSALYEQFVSIVTAARPRLDRNKLINDYGAHIFLANEAQNLGFIDGADATYNSTLQALVAAAGIQEGEAYQVVELTPPHSFISELTRGQSPLITGKLSHVFQLGPMNPNLSGKFLYLYQP